MPPTSTLRPSRSTPAPLLRWTWLPLTLCAALASAQAPGPASRPAPIQGGTLTTVVPQEPTSLVSFLDTKTDNRDVSAKITEGLLRYDRQFLELP